MQQPYRPGPVGLYEPRDERDACGFGLIAQLDDAPSRAIVDRAIDALVRMTHRGGIAAEANDLRPEVLEQRAVPVLQGDRVLKEPFEFRGRQVGVVLLLERRDQGALPVGEVLGPLPPPRLYSR